MEETRSKLNSTQRIVVNFLQQLVTECTDRVPATQPCTVASTTGYSVPTRYWLHSLCTAYPTPPPPPNWLQSHPTQSIQLCVDSGAGRQLVTPQPLRAVGVLFSPMVSGWAGGRREIVCPGCISETVRCRKFILGRDIGWGGVGVQRHGLTLI